MKGKIVKKLLLLITALCLYQLGMAQSVTGTVTDSDKSPLENATVRVKNTGTAVNTGSNGEFTINAARGDILVVSFIGYQTAEVEVGDGPLLIWLTQEVEKVLEDVVVIGYGQQSRRNLTTAISKVSEQDIGVQKVTTPGEALAALAPGVQVQSGRGGTPGAPPIIRVRGIGSVGGSNDVLYVVDGYPLQNPNNFNQINPADIESMEILKDAAAAAIYGSRAANGVVIVTTKRGKSGRTKFDLNASHGLQSVAQRYDMMNKDEYLDFATRVAGIRNTPYPDIFDNRASLPDTDWQDLIFRTANVSDFQLSATGGNENIRHMTSGGYFKQEGTLRGTGFERYTLRFNLDASLNSKLKVGVSMAPSYSEQSRMPATGQWNNSSDGNIGRSLPNVLQGALLMPPIINVRTPNGDYGQPNAEPATAQYGFMGTNLFNPLSTIEHVTNRFRNYSFLGNTFLEWEPLKALKLKTSLGATFDHMDQYGYIPPFVSTNTAHTANINEVILGNTWAIERGRTETDWLWENTVNYQTTVGEHFFDVLAFGSAQRFSLKGVSTNGKVGTYSNYIVRNPSASTDLQGEIQYDDNAFLSFGGRLAYDFQKKYFVTAAIRRDGSSKFGPNHRYSNFPSISAAWRIIDENFMDGATDVLSDLKLRVSYGETGNANIGSFTWANQISARNYVFGGVRNTGSIQAGLANFDLTWEKNKQYNFGLDFGILGDKIVVGADYYVRNTDGMLLNRDLPGIYGYATTARTNLGSLENRGFEVNVRTNFSSGMLRYTADYNFSTNRNRVTSLGGPDFLPPQGGVFGWNNMYQIVVDQPLGNINGFIVEGIFKNEDDLARYPQWNDNGNQVGDWRIRDVDGDGIITEADRTLLGNAIPRYTYGSTQRLAYKSFDLTLMLQGVAGVHVLNGNFRQLYGNLFGNMNVPADVVDNFFDPANPDRDVKYHRIGGVTGVTMNNQATNYSVLDASFLRVRNLTLGYTLPAALLSRLKIQNARVYLSGQNLFTFTSYPGGNPEASVASSAGSEIGDSPFTPGIDHGSYPAIRTMTFGINLSI